VDRDRAADPPAELVETHISVLVFLGDRAYKLKKPVRFAFLDFSTREAREAACHREVELNRRLAPDVYLGVADVRGPGGEAWDHLVVMRRLPSARRLSTMVAGHEPTVPGHLRALARRIASFHAAAARGPDIDASATRDAVAAAWEDNVREMAPFVGPVLDPEVVERVTSRFRAYLAGREPLFAERIAHGHVRDGHGDLQAADVFCLDDGPRVLDCIEFNDRFRHGDVLNDVAFLAMDLERLGAPHLATRFLDDYREFSGETAPASLAHHYIAYRAHVRTKVACLRWAQEEPGSPGATEALHGARRLLELCDRHLDHARVRLVAVGGLPGTGKTTLARGLGDRLGWPVLRSDEVRKELAGLSPLTPARAPYGEGIYDDAATEATYAELLRRAIALAARGGSVVLDASWIRVEHRERLRRAAADVHAELAELRCVAPRSIAAERIGVRLARRADASDATAEVAAAMAADADPWPEAVVVDTSGPKPASLRAALDALGV
jgi:aminoglycoside phosphotransferase family enzyme/predicted kinase